MITKIIGFQLDLSGFSSIKQIIQLNDGYVIFGQEDFEQKLKSVTMQLNSQKLMYFRIQEGKCISEKPYQIGEGLAVLSNIGTIQNQITALISRQGNRSLVQFNPIEHTNVYLIQKIPYKQYEVQYSESDYMIYCFTDRVTLVGLYQTESGVLVECTNHPNGIHIMKKFKSGEKVTSFRIQNTNNIAFLEGEELHMFDGQDEIFSMNIQVPLPFKIKFMIEINDEYVLIVKDRMDKFYKFLNKGCDVEYFHTLKCQELLNGTLNIQTQKKQSINLTKIKDNYHIWISTIYYQNGEQILFVNAFKITDDCEAIFIQGFKLCKSKQIQFVQKDEFVHEYLLFKDEQTIKAIYVSQ